MAGFVTKLLLVSVFVVLPFIVAAVVHAEEDVEKQDDRCDIFTIMDVQKTVGVHKAVFHKLVAHFTVCCGQRALAPKLRTLCLTI